MKAVNLVPCCLGNCSSELRSGGALVAKREAKRTPHQKGAQKGERAVKQKAMQSVLIISGQQVRVSALCLLDGSATPSADAHHPGEFGDRRRGSPPPRGLHVEMAYLGAGWQPGTTRTLNPRAPPHVKRPSGACPSVALPSQLCVSRVTLQTWRAVGGTLGPCKVGAHSSVAWSREQGQVGDQGTPSRPCLCMYGNHQRRHSTHSCCAARRVQCPTCQTRRPESVQGPGGAQRRALPTFFFCEAAGSSGFPTAA